METDYISTYLVKNKLIYRPVFYPEIDFHDQDKYIISTDGDRLDNLSNEFYNTTDNWWIIAVANTLNASSMYIEAGLQIRIPFDIETIMNDFKQLNEIDVYF